MPIATPETYRHMIDTAKEQSFAFPAVNCVGSEAVNAALKGFADAGSDGIILRRRIRLRARSQRHDHRGGRVG